MSFKEKLYRRKKCNEVVYEAYGKIDQEVKTSEKGVKGKNETEENLAKKLPFFLNKKKNENTCDLLMNVSEHDEDVYFISKTIKTYLNLNEPVRIRLSLLYNTAQYDLFRNYLIAIRDMYRGIFALKVTRNGNIKKKKILFTTYNINIIGTWTRKIILYDEVTQVYISNSCTPELHIFEKKFEDYVNRKNYIVIRTLYRDYSFLFLRDDEIVMKIKKKSAMGKIKHLLKKNELRGELKGELKNELIFKGHPGSELQDNTISTTGENCEDHLKNTHKGKLAMKDKIQDINATAQGFKFFFLRALRNSKTQSVDIDNEDVREMLKKNNMIQFDKYDFKNQKINSLFLFLQIMLDLCGPEIWFTSKFDEILFTHLN
ncbi:conserved Plasmodium protein, unknown function [Plasmodium ovale]|uniref:Uncharacterized protein n=1 Tax=Plasmodium ovale TaxID=36330 RepID=A0A1D3TJY3_PLAOA|nr:conserved Plasmodium protein, unknown function [Plasmodium ovale]